jgi:hypothetical protein
MRIGKRPGDHGVKNTVFLVNEDPDTGFFRVDFTIKMMR